MLDQTQSKSDGKHNQQDRDNNLNRADGYFLKEPASQPCSDKSASNSGQQERGVLAEINGRNFLHVDGEACEVNKASDDNAGCHKFFMIEAASSKEHASKRALMPRQSAKKAAEQSSHWKIFFIERHVVQFWDRLKPSEHNHQRGNRQFDWRDLKGTAHHLVFGDARKIGEPQEHPCADKRGHNSWKSETHDDFPVGMASDQNQFKQIVREVDDRRHGDRHIEREEGRERWKQKRSQSKPGKKSEERGRKRDDADDPEHRVNLPNAFQVSVLSHA